MLKSVLLILQGTLNVLKESQYTYRAHVNERNAEWKFL